MPRKKSTYTKADIARVWDALKAKGEEPLYVKHTADGGFRVVTRAYIEATQQPEQPSDWDDTLAPPAT